MRNTLTLLGMLAMVVACAEGDDDRDDGAGTEAGTVADDSGGTSGDDGGTMTATSVTSATSATTATTATTDPSGDPETSGTEDGDPETTGGEATGCTAYCDVYLAGCVDFNEYANEADCVANCEQWPIGEMDETAEDSLGCRLYHATVASSTDPELHCPHAGPSGAGMCIAGDAPTCELYCTRYFENCTGELNVFEDEAACMAECGQWYPGSKADVDGHTVGCHSYHANAAAGDPEMHCPHAAPGGGGICVL